MTNYILDGHETTLEPDLLKWARWFKQANRRVARTTIGAGEPETWVSTVFLGINHNFGEGPPLLFETMIFNGPLHDEQERYGTWDEAVAGHKAMVAKAKAVVH